MADIQYWDDTLTEELTVIQHLVDDIPSLDGMQKTAAIEKCKQKVRGATGTKRSFKMEIRLVTDVAQRRKYEGRLGKLDQKLKAASADCKAMEAELNRGELFVEAEHGNHHHHNGGNAPDGVAAGNNMLKEAAGLQDKTQDSLANTRSMIADSKEVGAATLEELERQREVLTSIERETDRIDDNLARAEVLLKQFGKRMASDHFIQCFAMINCMLLCGVVFYAIIKGKSLSPGEKPPADPFENGGRNGATRLLLRQLRGQWWNDTDE